ncbi:MAG: hypothetical protein EXX96DRAFT_619346 [Benjaminiella poitrasii]|nr:MAG: hypothetical protein EXX96DRAFT_619346 [Benjaminiella poitrasii]
MLTWLSPFTQARNIISASKIKAPFTATFVYSKIQGKVAEFNLSGLHPLTRPVAHYQLRQEAVTAQNNFNRLYRNYVAPRSNINRLQTFKEAQIKSNSFNQHEDEIFCPVRTLLAFITTTVPIRQDLPDDHTLFLTYLGSSKRHTPIGTATVANWDKPAMASAGIETNSFSAHSLRT